MTYKTDPSRWTDSLAEAPDVLRGPLAAGRNEAPSDLQMKALAVKLAALSAGTAAAATAATAKAAASTAASGATTAGGATAGGATAASVGTLSVAKVAISVALFGATITGAVVWQSKSAVRQESQGAPAAQVAQEAPVAEQDLRPVEQQPGERMRATRDIVDPAASAPAVARDVAADAAPVTSPADEPAARQSTRSVSSANASGTSSTRAPRAARSSAAQAPASKSATSAMSTGAPSTVGASEVDLLRQARAALASRPREAFAITQTHRQQYPRGVFAQERDALAIEALMRAGELKTARGLAERFVREHPSSPHTHRFNETILR